MPFILGRPLGSPGDPAFQHRVLDTALAMLEQTDGPLMVQFKEDATAAASGEDPWVCPVAFRQPETESTLADRVQGEVQLLQPWYDQGRSSRAGRTAFGLTGMTIEETVSFLAEFTKPEQPADSAEEVKLAAEDLKAFYNEAAVSQPGTASASAIADWYWQQTEAGALIKAIRETCKSSEDRALKLTAKLLLVPH